MLVQCHENTGWRATSEVSGKEHQTQEQETPSPAHFEVPALSYLLVLQMQLKFTLSHSLRMTPAII